jgi:hypothetical protein
MGALVGASGKQMQNTRLNRCSCMCLAQSYTDWESARITCNLKPARPQCLPHCAEYRVAGVPVSSPKSEAWLDAGRKR